MKRVDVYWITGSNLSLITWEMSFAYFSTLKSCNPKIEEDIKLKASFDFACNRFTLDNFFVHEIYTTPSSTNKALKLD